ncbi:DUF433 domain-containing protein [Crocosphaera chwakensis]|uniref:DUF433 domain-containing protein n=1 Tax=Crocosphaera chwakensis CCY0110 TaxID=391612 RepID=A3IKU8_9CHRO|nr:DUF433 domain-containing protein [Crocosphaera chwakensis]EAZ92817.1 hypothetical protein CY0110_22012 [Crocosphaera chwakensis CCY0110]
MASISTDYKYINLNEQGTAIITGSTLKVIDLVMAKMAYGWTPEEIQINHRHLTMSQIHSAFAYYWEHKEQLDQEIQQEVEYVKKLRSQAGDSPFVTRLKAEGVL